MYSKKWISIWALSISLVAVSCKKSSEPTPEDDNTTSTTNDSANCISGIITDLSSFPYSLQPVFYPDGIWSGAWNDADAASPSGDLTFVNADSCYGNSYISLQHKIGSNGYFGLSLINQGNWTADITIPAGGASTKFSAKVTSGYKFIWTTFPEADGINQADSLIGDGLWHDYTTTFTQADTQTVISVPMTFQGRNAGGLAVGDTAFIQIRNLRIDN